ncbi:MAG: hypothetical protein Q9182_001205 [Xanthomendoza sp. 2 TL-2023]
MSNVRKYAGLIELDDAAPDVYETPELTDDSLTVRAPSTLRSDSRASSTDGLEGDNPAIDRHRIDPNEARNGFLDNEVKDTAPQGWIGSKRTAYRTSSKRVHNGRLEEGFVDSTDEDDEDNLEGKLARLRREVAEVKEAFQRRRKEAEANSRAPVTNLEDESMEKKGADSIATLDSLGHVLEEIERPEDTGHHDSARRLNKKLEDRYQSMDLQTPQEPTQVVDNHDTSRTSVADLTHVLSRASDFDKRMRLLETALGMDLIPLPTQDRSAFRAILPVLDGLDRQISTISNTESSIDRVGRQIRQLTEDAEKLAEARKAAAAQAPSNQLSSERKRTSATKREGHVDEETADADQTSKINALYGTLPTIESLSPLLPSVLHRLRSLRTIHADAANASESLTTVESRQAAMGEEIKEWRDGLKKVESAIQQGEMSMKENTNVIDSWVKELENRVQKTHRPSHG